MATFIDTIYAIRSGNWELSVESLRDLITFTFTVIVAEMAKLEFTNPSIFAEFLKGKLSLNSKTVRNFLE